MKHEKEEKLKKEKKKDSSVTTNASVVEKILATNFLFFPSTLKAVLGTWIVLSLTLKENLLSLSQTNCYTVNIIGINKNLHRDTYAFQNHANTLTFSKYH